MMVVGAKTTVILLQENNNSVKFMIEQVIIAIHLDGKTERKIKMSHTIHLTKNHQRMILEALLESQTIKENKLVKQDSIQGMIAQYNRAAERIWANDIECGKMGHRPTDNLFGWIRDQILHSRGMEKTEFGSTVINICEAAGENRYDKFCQMTIINTLFE